MVLKQAQGMRLGIVLALLVSVGVLLGPSALTHSHDGGFTLSHCEACRWAGDATPALVVLLAFLLTLPESGQARAPLTPLRAQASRRRIRSRGPPLV